MRPHSSLLRIICNNLLQNYIFGYKETRSLFSCAAFYNVCNCALTTVILKAVYELPLKNRIRTSAIYKLTDEAALLARHHEVKRMLVVNFSTSQD